MICAFVYCRHEIVGVVTEVGSNVHRFKIGDKVGVGYVISSCTACDNCKQDFENYCPKFVPTSNGIGSDGKPTYGGFSNLLVANERYVVRLPNNLPLEKIVPLLCAGVTVYTPMKYHGLNVPGKHLGVVGLGGLGHVAVKFGKAHGMKVTVISTSPSKEKEAIEQLGADAFLVSRDPDQMKVKLEQQSFHKEYSIQREYRHNIYVDIQDSVHSDIFFLMNLFLLIGTTIFS